MNPMEESGLAPEFLIHWGHAGAMAMVLLAMGGYGPWADDSEGPHKTR